MNRLNNLIATVFKVGYLPMAPGTWSSLVAVLVWYFLFKNISSIQFLLISIITFLIGVVVSKQLIKDTGKKDPSEVVIDELAGQWFALLMVPHSVNFAIASFIIFRILDIIKPFSISELEKYPNGWGVMLDDLAAGLITSGLINTYIYFS